MTVNRHGVFSGCAAGLVLPLVTCLSGHRRLDVESLLWQISVPTLMLHCRDDAAVSFEEGHRVAAGIPEGRLVAL